MIDNINRFSSEEKKDFFDKHYKQIVKEGRQYYHSIDTFSEACKLTLKLCLSLNDYIHANNILQCYKSEVLRERSAWYHYYSIIVHGKRYPKYFLNKPEMLVKKIQRYYKKEPSQSLEAVLKNLLFFYVKLFDNYKDVFTKDLKSFTTYFLDNPLDNHLQFNNGIKQIDDLIENRIDYEDVDFDIVKDVSNKEKHHTIAEDSPHEHETIIYGKDPKVLIIGDLSISKDKVYGIAKSVGFEKHQIEIVEDFKAIKTYDINKLQYNYDYCGIIFGPLPHSTKGAQGDSSLITRVENGEGFPYNIRSIANGKLKITKSSLESALRDVHSNYLVTVA